MTEALARLQDSIASMLRSYAQHILVLIFGLLPILFVPSIVAPSEYTKVVAVIVGVCLATILFSLSVLRSGVMKVGVSYPLCALWLIALLGVTSALLSGDMRDALLGDVFSIHTASFLLLIALIPTIFVALRPKKSVILKMYILLAVSTLLLVLYHFARLIFGADFLPFQIFTTATTTPVGSWNDLALFLGLAVILSLIALEQLTLTKLGRSLFVIVCVISLAMLGVINFFLVWVILGLTSLALVVYSLGKDRFHNGQLTLLAPTTQVSALPVALLVCAISIMFIVAGSFFGGILSQYTQVSYIEVRPSFEATTNIARAVYADNALFGIGPNRFSDAWRMHKDLSINTTQFWNVDFPAGNSYIGTFFITTGMLGGIAWTLFLVLYIGVGLRRLLVPQSVDKIWYFIAVSSFAGGLYVWILTIVYVPGVVLLLLGALCTGVSLYAMNMLTEREGKVLSIANDRRTGFVLSLGVVLVIVASVGVLYFIGRHYAAAVRFNESIRGLNEGRPLAETEQLVLLASQLSSSDAFSRRIAEYQLTRLNGLMAAVNPTEAQQKEFLQAFQIGEAEAQNAIRIDATEPNNWRVLGGLYGVLSLAQVPGASDKALESFERARQLDPKNPLPYLESAVVVARAGNANQAREYIKESIRLKPNFTEALYLLTQLEIETGNIDAAVQSVVAVIQLEPQNAARYYQLGVLENARNNVDAAIGAFETAVSITPDYANARYLLALAYDFKGKNAEAREQLEKVLALNPGNPEVTELLRVIERDGSLGSLRGAPPTTIPENEPATGEGGTVSTTRDSETSLVTPVNTIPKTNDEAATAEQVTQ